MSQRTLSFLARYDVPPEILWGVVTDHEGMGRWMGARTHVIASPPDGGQGTVRRMKAGPFTIDEEVILYDPPRRMAYRMVRGLPLRYHRGEVRIAPWGDGGSELSWEITVSSAIPGFTQAIATALAPRINRGLRTLAGILDEG